MKEKMFDLRFFDEGGAAEGAEGAEGAAEGGGTERDYEKEFSDLVGDENFKGIYDKRIKDAVKAERKKFAGTNQRLSDAESLLGLLSHRYKTERGDLQALRQAIEKDTRYVQDEALAAGMPEDMMAEYDRVLYENTEYRRMEEEEKNRAAFNAQLSEWRGQAEGLKEIYPELDFDAECENDDFFRLLAAGCDVKTAYETQHMDDILTGAVRRTASVTEKKVADSVRANGRRPTENGTGGRAGGDGKFDVSKLTKAERAAYVEKAMRNPDEDITFK